MAVRLDGRPKARRVDSIAAEQAFRVAVAAQGGRVMSGWLGSLKPHRVICAAGHECMPRPAAIVHNGQGICRMCAGRDPVSAEAKFRACVAALGGTVLGAYVNVKTPVRVRCSCGHEQTPTPGAVNRGQGICYLCADKVRAAKKKADSELRFLTAVAQQGGTVLGDYVGAGVPVHVRCAAGHNNYPRPGDINHGTGICFTCGHKRGRGIIAEQKAVTFRALLAAQHPGARIVGAYVNSGKPLHIVCSADHDCYPRPDDIVQGQGLCRVCAGSAWDVFYVVNNLTAARVKFGVTSGSPKARLRTHRRQGYVEVVRLRERLASAATLEQHVIRSMREAGIKPAHGREYYDLSALPVVLDIVDHWEVAA